MNLNNVINACGSNSGKKPTVVVSGLPRSGTSLMMQMLEAGGIRPLQDAQRQADSDNPHGYYELEPVKRLSTDSSVLNHANGYAVKVIHRFLPYLPIGINFSYAIIVMRRDMDEVLASQQTMLDRLGKSASRLDASKLGSVLSKQLEDAIQYAQTIPNARVLEVEHRMLFNKSAEVVEAIADFLEGAPLAQSGQRGHAIWPEPLNRDAMRQTIEPTLYRQRNSN